MQYDVFCISFSPSSHFKYYSVISVHLLPQTDVAPQTAEVLSAKTHFPQKQQLALCCFIWMNLPPVCSSPPACAPWTLHWILKYYTAGQHDFQKQEEPAVLLTPSYQTIKPNMSVCQLTHQQTRPKKKKAERSCRVGWCYQEYHTSFTLLQIHFLSIHWSIIHCNTMKKVTYINWTCIR